MGIPTVWTKGCKDTKEKEALETLLTSNTIIIRKLLEILAERKEFYNRQEVNPEAYDNPAWAYKQAHTNGAKTELKFIEALFNFK